MMVKVRTALFWAASLVLCVLIAAELQGDTGSMSLLRVSNLRFSNGEYGLKIAIADAAGAQITSFGGGTEYTENATDASITGGVAMMEVAGDAIEPIQGTVADGLLVNLGTNNDVTVTGTITTTSDDQQADDDNIAFSLTVPVVANLNYCDNATNWERCAASLITEAAHDGALGTITSVVSVPGAYRAADFTGSAAMVTAVSADDDLVLAVATRFGIGVGFLTNEDGSKQLGKLEDDAHVTADYGVPIWFRRIDAPATSAGTSGDWATPDADENGAMYVTPIATNAGGASNLKYTSAGSTEDEHAVCTGPCNVYSITATNHTATGVFLRCENDTQANTAPGSETVELDLEIPGDASGRGFNTVFPVGSFYSTALTCWVVLGEADTDVAEVGANDVKLYYTFKQ